MNKGKEREREGKGARERTVLGLELIARKEHPLASFQGKVGLLCHSASLTADYAFAPSIFKKVFGKNFVKIFGPQHGLFTNLQDNMIETQNFIHPYFKLPVYSLYSETRVPTDEMLSGLDCLFVDLQDIGHRVYTYISTVFLLLEKISVQRLPIKVVILDRPNPLGGIKLEGTMIRPDFLSFVGIMELPARHGLTIGEIAKLAVKEKKWQVDLEIVKMQNWSRQDYFPATGLPWVLPSPNLPCWEGALCFPGTVLFEGTNVSEGRGTTRALEIIGHPNLEPYTFVDEIQKNWPVEVLQGVVLRPLSFTPTFNKHMGQACGGIQIHVTDPVAFRPWLLGQMLLQEIYWKLGKNFSWKTPPYEYEWQRLPIDMINGGEELRQWVEQKGSYQELLQLESGQGERALTNFEQKRNEILLY